MYGGEKRCMHGCGGETSGKEDLGVEGNEF